MTLGGITASSLGLIVRELPRFPIARQTGVEAIVPGRDGTLFLPDGGYAPVTAKAKLLMPPSCDGDAVRAWCAAQGDLIVSTDPLRKRHVLVETVFSRYAPGIQLLTMTLTGAPFRAEVTGEMLSVSTARTTFTGCGDVPSRPDLEVDGAGTISLTLNGVTVTLSDMVYGQKVHIDCENRVAYKVTGGASVRVTLPSDTWPVCGTGVNVAQCAGTVAEAHLWPNWKWK